jgi:hypothetical protein
MVSNDAVRGCGGGVGVHPSLQRGRSADEVAHLVEVTLHYALEVAVEEVGARALG